MDRRGFLQVGGGGLVSLAPALAAGRSFRFGVIADTHIIDGLYRGPENSPLDTESIRKTTERLTTARDFLNGLEPALEAVFLVGDYFHDYPSPDPDFYFQNETRLDRAKKLTDGFRMPVHVGFGNHDYDVPEMPREASHELFRRKFGLNPYYSVDLHGWKFVHLNNFLGATWDANHAGFNKRFGSLGEEQLNWFEAELEQRKPAFVFIHYPLLLIAERERADYGLPGLLKKHRGTVRQVVSGHWHKWAEFGRTFSVPHLVMAATRYDPNAYLIVEADRDGAGHRFLNLDRVDWNTHYSQPYSP
ncbi:MAG: metallophosphoesterase [Bryobacterales bacterium]|nr:metallophosphoesterase [Bryobacterales bacterium]